MEKEVVDNLSLFISYQQSLSLRDNLRLKKGYWWFVQPSPVWSITKDVLPSPPVRLEGLGSGQVQVPTGQVGPGLVLGVAQVRHLHLLQYHVMWCLLPANNVDCWLLRWCPRRTSVPPSWRQCRSTTKKYRLQLWPSMKESVNQRESLDFPHICCNKNQPRVGLKTPLMKMRKGLLRWHRPATRKESWRPSDQDLNLTSLIKAKGRAF